MTERFPWLDEPPLADLLDCLDQGGEEARVVGGAVRNALLGEPVTEWDIATTALPAEVARRARAKGWKVVPTGIEHGTVTVVAAGHPFEVTTLRQDVETDGRHAVVRFGRDFAADAFRRDFTINALSVGRDGQLHDYAGGLADLRARRVRFIGDADQRIAEDYLRILRLFRFHARYGEGPIDRSSLGAAIRLRGGLAKLSRERIRAELLKLLAAPKAPAVVAEIDGAGFCLKVLGGVARPLTLARLVMIETDEGLGCEPVRRLGALGLFVLEDAVRIAERLRLSRAESTRLKAMAVAGESRCVPPTPQQARAALYAMGREGFRDAALLAWARSGDPAWSAALDLARSWPIPVRPFGGRQLETLGLSPGPQLGRVLALAEQLWIEADFPEGEEALADLLSQAIAADR
jgi:tRNA nucleotidyltransferase/poly(A) polymerase